MEHKIISTYINSLGEIDGSLSPTIDIYDMSNMTQIITAWVMIYNTTIKAYTYTLANYDSNKEYRYIIDFWVYIDNRYTSWSIISNVAWLSQTQNELLELIFNRVNIIAKFDNSKIIKKYIHETEETLKEVISKLDLITLFNKIKLLEDKIDNKNFEIKEIKDISNKINKVEKYISNKDKLEKEDEYILKFLKTIDKDIYKLEKDEIKTLDLIFKEISKIDKLEEKELKQLFTWLI